MADGSDRPQNKQDNPQKKTIDDVKFAPRVNVRSPSLNLLTQCLGMGTLWKWDTLAWCFDQAGDYSACAEMPATQTGKASGT